MVQPKLTMHYFLLVYLQTSPKTCYDRLKMRCREEEKVIPMVRKMPSDPLKFIIQSRTWPGGKREDVSSSPSKDVHSLRKCRELNSHCRFNFSIVLLEGWPSTFWYLRKCAQVLLLFTLKCDHSFSLTSSAEMKFCLPFSSILTLAAFSFR